MLTPISFRLKTRTFGRSQAVYLANRYLLVCFSFSFFVRFFFFVELATTLKYQLNYLEAPTRKLISRPG